MVKNLTNKTNLPDSFCRAIDERERQYTKGDADYSATGLMKPARIHHLTKRYWKQISEDYSGKLDSWIGTLMHNALALHEGVEVISERLYVNIIGKRISGETDHYHRNEKKIQDYKYTGVYSFTSGSKDDDYEAQLNTYAYLHIVNGFDVQTLEIVFFFKDWKLSEAKRNPDYPQKKVLVKSFRLWSIGEMESYIKDQIMKLETTEHFFDYDLSICSKEDRWETEIKFSVRKFGNKRPTKSFPLENQAFEFVEKMKIEKPKEIYDVSKTGGEPKRCISWCSVSQFCDFGKKYLKEEPEDI